MRSLVSTLALVCLAALGGVCQSTDAASDRIVVVGNKAQPVQWNHRETIQEAINLAKPSGTVIIPTNYPGADCNPLSNCNPGNVCVIDWRINGVGTGNCNGGNGGLGTGVAGSPTNVQVNNNGSLGGAPDFRYDFVNHQVFVPDGSIWGLTGITAPNNALITLEGNYNALPNVTGFTNKTTNGVIVLQGGPFAFPQPGGRLEVHGSTAATNPNIVDAVGTDATHFTEITLFPFVGVGDGTGYVFSNGVIRFNADTGFLFGLDRSNKSAHFYGALNFPDAAGTGNTFGAAGAVPVSSGGSGTPTKFSNEITGTYVAAGSFGVCPSPPSIPSSGGTILAANVSSICFGPSGHIKGSWAGDAYDDLVRVSNIPSGGIQCCIGLSQVDLTAFDARYIPINAVPQYNTPEGGAAGAGLQPGPCNDSAAGIYNCNTVFTAGAGIPNDTSTGTTLGLLAKLSAGKMVKIGTGDTNVPVFLITNNAGTTGNTWPLFAGIGSATFDGPTTAGDFVGASSTVAGDSTDLGSSFAAINGNHAVIGQVLSTNGSAGTYSVLLTQAAQTPYYQTIRENSTDQTQRSKLRLISGSNVTVSCADNSGAGSTDCTVASTGGGGGTGKMVIVNQGSVAAVANAANATKLWGIVFPLGVTTATRLIYEVNTADNSANLYNIAIFDTSGNIVCQTGATAGTTIAASTGGKNIALSGSCSVVAGTTYYLGVTGNAATMVLGGINSGDFLCNTVPTSNNTTASAVWTTPIGIPADNNVACNTPEIGLNK